MFKVVNIRDAVDNASILTKLLVTPGLAILALAMICGLAWQGFNAESEAATLVAELTRHRLRQASDAKLQAASLQADMFRFTTLGLLGMAHVRLVKLGADITGHEAALRIAVGEIQTETSDAGEHARLQHAMALYTTQSTYAVANLLADPGWGAASARNAALALDGVIEALDAEQHAAVAAVAAALDTETALNHRERTLMLLTFGVGSPAMVLASLLMAHRIAGPVRRMTKAMERLAGRDYDCIVPATARRDEIGAMARAVEVFKEGLLRADALAVQQLATQAFLDTVLESVPAPILVKTVADMRYVFVNCAAETFFGAARQSLLGRTASELAPSGIVASVEAADAEAVATGRKIVSEGVVMVTSGNGERLSTMTRIAIGGPDGMPKHLLVMIDDITDRRLAERRIAYMAHFDALTGLPNRVLFADRLSEALMDASAGRTRVAVLGLDLDHFKEVNDTLGHAAGDVLLRSVSARLGACLRRGDTLARLGGDEFAVIQCGLQDSQDAEMLAGRLIEAAREPFDLDGQQAFVGLSAGIAFSTPGIEPDELVKQADVALYEAKKHGRGCCQRFAPAMSENLRQRRMLEHDLRAAMERGEICLHFQPQVDLSSFAIVGAEALARWPCPQRGNVPPSVFIPAAEDTGLIGPLGECLLRLACVEAARWPAALRLAINVSPLQLRLPGFVETVASALDGAGLDPGRLELELTEGILHQSAPVMTTAYAGLRALGVKLALDDFGTGHASLGMLQKFRFDRIKVDGSFVSGLCTNPTAAAIVGAVAGLGRSLDITTIAEGVETDEEIDVLRSLGCTEAQGYRFWKPMDATAMNTLAAQTAKPRRARPALHQVARSYTNRL